MCFTPIAAYSRAHLSLNQAFTPQQRSEMLSPICVWQTILSRWPRATSSASDYAWQRPQQALHNWRRPRVLWTSLRTQADDTKSLDQMFGACDLEKKCFPLKGSHAFQRLSSCSCRFLQQKQNKSLYKVIGNQAEYLGMVQSNAHCRRGTTKIREVTSEQPISCCVSEHQKHAAVTTCLSGWWPEALNTTANNPWLVQTTVSCALWYPHA